MKAALPLVLSASVLATACLAEEVVVSQSAWGEGAGIEGTVAALAVQPDGKVIVGGSFQSVNGVPRNNIARLNPDGTLDRTFADTVEAGVNGPVLALAVRPDGCIVVGGNFNEAAGTERLNLVLYRPDGSIDPGFASRGQPGVNGPVAAIAAQPDGKVVIGGSFTAVCGQPRMAIARINADGTLDSDPVAGREVVGKVSALAAAGPSASVAGGDFQVTNQRALSLLRAGGDPRTP